jgi:hypothetical protein
MYYLEIFLEGLRKVTKSSVKVDGVSAGIRTGHLPNTSQKCCRVLPLCSAHPSVIVPRLGIRGDMPPDRHISSCLIKLRGHFKAIGRPAYNYHCHINGLSE